MPINSKREAQRFFLVFLTALVLSSGEVSAAAGRFLFVSGDVKVVNAAGLVRTVVKGDEFNEGETVVTAAAASAQLNMADGGFIAVRPDTQLKIEMFRFEGKEDGNEKSFLGLLKGSFRAITGTIGRLNKSNYSITTPSATIGIRGTDHEPMVILPATPGQAALGAPGTYDKVNVGMAVIQTAQGSVNILPTQVGYVSDNTSKPTILPRTPTFYQSTAAPVERKSSQAATGQATTGQATTGQATTGQAATGQAATGQAATGQAATGQAATGQARGSVVSPQQIGAGVASALPQRGGVETAVLQSPGTSATGSMPVAGGVAGATNISVSRGAPISISPGTMVTPPTVSLPITTKPVEGTRVDLTNQTVISEQVSRPPISTTTVTGTTVAPPTSTTTVAPTVTTTVTPIGTFIARPPSGTVLSPPVATTVIPTTTIRPVDTTVSTTTVIPTTTTTIRPVDTTVSTTTVIPTTTTTIRPPTTTTTVIPTTTTVIPTTTTTTTTTPR